MKLRTFAASALAAGMAAFGLSACQTASNQPAPTDTGSVITQAPVEGATELELWTFVELHGKFYTTMAEQWNELHPDKKIQIKVNALPYDDMHNKLQIALTSGTGAPDIADIEAGKFPQFVQGTPALMDLTAAAAPYKDDIVQARLDLFSANGGLYGLDFHVGATVAFYNTELLEAAGIDYTTIKTWDDFREQGAKYHEATGKYLGTVDTSAAWATGLLLAQLGGEYFDASGKINLTSPEMTKAMEIFKGLQDAGAAAVPPGGQPDTEEAYGAYNNGEFAAAVMPFWFTSRYLAYMPELSGKIVIAPPPTVDNPKSISVGGGGTGTAVIKDKDHAELAAEFVGLGEALQGRQHRDLEHAGLRSAEHRGVVRRGRHAQPGQRVREVLQEQPVRPAAGDQGQHRPPDVLHQPRHAGREQYAEHADVQRHVRERRPGRRRARAGPGGPRERTRLTAT